MAVPWTPLKGGLQHIHQGPRVKTMPVGLPVPLLFLPSFSTPLGSSDLGFGSEQNVAIHSGIDGFHSPPAEQVDVEGVPSANPSPSLQPQVAVVPTPKIVEPDSSASQMLASSDAATNAPSFSPLFGQAMQSSPSNEHASILHSASHVPSFSWVWAHSVHSRVRPAGSSSYKVQLLRSLCQLTVSHLPPSHFCNSATHPEGAEETFLYKKKKQWLMWMVSFPKPGGM